MPDKNFKYTIGLDVDAKTLKTAIKNDVRDALKEVDKIGDALSKGLSPDTSSLEGRLDKLEAYMTKLHEATNGTKEEFTTMKKAFTGFVELQAKVNNLEDSIGTINTTLNNSSSAIQAFMTAFTTNNPEQALAAMSVALKHVGNVGVNAASGMQQMKDAAQQAADASKKALHDIETTGAHGAKVVDGAVETIGRSVSEAKKELERLEALRESYAKNKDYKGMANQESLRGEIEEQKTLYIELQKELAELTEEDAEYNKTLSQTIENGQKLLALWDKLDTSNPRSAKLKGDIFFKETEEDISYFISDYKELIKSIPAEINKVELKPLKLKVDISDDGKLLEQVNKQIDKLNANAGLHKIEIEALFVDPVDKADVDLNDENIESDKTYKKIEKSLKKQIKRLNTAFEKETKDLTDKISEFKKNIDESLELKFDWQKGNNASEIEQLFELVQELSYNNKIILHPDTDDFINKIDEALKAHEFTLKLDNSDVALNAKIVGGVPIAGGFSGGPLTRGPSKKPSQSSAPQQPARAPDASPASAEEKRQTKVVDNNSEAVVDNTAAIQNAVQAFKNWIGGVNRGLGSGDQNKIDNAMARKHAMNSIVGFDPTELNDNQLAEKVADLLQNTTIAESLKNAKTNVPELKSRGISLVTDNFLEKFIGAQDTIGTQRSTHQVETIKHSHKQYYEFAEMIARMGGSLKKSFVNEGVIPGVKSLEQVGELFEGTAYTNLAKSAYEYADAVKKVSNEFADGGNLYEYMQSLDTKKNSAQGVLDSSNATKKERDDATKTINEVNAIKTQIIDQLRPFGEKYEAERKQVAGLIASISKGFKFTLTLKGENGKEDYKLSFNDKTAEADYHVQYYGEMLGRMNKIDWDNDVVDSEFSSTINNTPLHLLYDNVMGKKDAVGAVVSQYNALDDQIKAFVNTFITDLNTFLDEAASAGQRWKVIEESFFAWQSKGSKLVLGINPTLDNKYKRTKDKEDSKTAIGQFLNVLEQSLSAYSPKRVSAAQQRQMGRGVEKGTGVSEATKNVPVSERRYKYTASDRAYRTEYSGAPTTVSRQMHKELMDVYRELRIYKQQIKEDKNTLDTLKKQQEKEINEQLTERGITKQQRDNLKLQYPNIKSQEDFGAAYESATSKYEESKKKASDLQSKIDAESKRIDDLDGQIQINHDFITAAQTRIENVNNAGGVKQYLDELNKQIQESENYANALRGEANKRNVTERQIAKYAFEHGEIDEEEYNKQIQEIDEWIKENERLVRSEQDKYYTLKQLRDNFTSSGIKNKDGSYLTAEEYERNQQQDIQSVIASSNKLTSDRLASTQNIESLRSDAQQAANESSAAYTELYNLEIAFNDEYQRYVKQQHDETKKKLEAAKSVQRQAKENFDSAQQAYNSKKTAVELENELISKETTEDSKKKHIETKERLESEMADADKVLQEAKQKQDEIDRSVESLSNRVSFLSQEIDNANNLRNPNITTEFDRELQEAQNRYNIEDSRIKEIENDKKTLEEKIRRLREGKNIAEAPISKMTQEQKETAVRKEVEAINEDFKLAEDKIEEAKKIKKDIDAELEYLSDSKHKISYGMRDRINRNYAQAERDLANNKDYQKFRQELDKQVGLDRETKKKKRREWVSNWIDQNDTTGKYKVTKEGYVADLKAAQTAQQGLIQAAKEYQGKLVEHKQAALDILGIKEEELFIQKEIKQTKLPQSNKASTKEHATSRVQEAIDVDYREVEQSNSINKAFLDEIDARVRDNDNEIAELRNKINSDVAPSKQDTKKFADHYAKAGANQIDEKADNANRAFYQTLKQGAPNKKGYTFADFGDVNNINAIITKAKELRAELGKMYNAGQEGSKEYIALQRQLSKLLDTTRKGVSKTALADGYEKNSDGTMSVKSWSQFLSDRGGAKLTNFVGSKTNVGSDNKFKDYLKTILAEKINGFSEEYQAAAEKAYYDAFNATKAKMSGSKKSSGQIQSAAYAAAQKAFEEFIKSGGKGFVQGVADSGDNSAEVEAVKAELQEEIEELEQENKDIRAFRERYIKGMLSGTEEDNDVLIKFLSSPEEMYGVVKQAKDEAESQINTSGKTDEQIKQETKELFKKILFRMLSEAVIGARTGIDESDDNFDDEYSSRNEYRVDSGQGYYEYGGLVQSDNIAIQASNVIVNGSTVGASGDGSAPWALNTNLNTTNEILRAISGKIDAVKSGSGSDNDSSTDSGGSKKKKKSSRNIDEVKSLLYAEADKDLNEAFGEGTKSVRRFDERTQKLYQTLTLANGEVVKLTYSMDKMEDKVNSSYTSVANFESVAKKAYTELGANKIATNNLLNDDNFYFPIDKINAYKQALIDLDTKLKSLGQKGVTTPENAAEVKVLTDNVKKCRTEIENMVKASNASTSKGTFIEKLNSNDINNVRASMLQLAEKIHGASVEEKNFDKNAQDLTFTVRSGKNEIQTLTYHFDALSHAVTETSNETRTTTGFFKSFFSDVGRKIGELARYYTGMSLLTEAFQKIRQGVQYVREIDAALTELKKVTNESESSYNRFLQTMSNTASVVGSTVSELTNSAAAWARLNI